MLIQSTFCKMLTWFVEPILDEYWNKLYYIILYSLSFISLNVTFFSGISNTYKNILIIRTSKYLL